jgi:hypothetical protein
MVPIRSTVTDSNGANAMLAIYPHLIGDSALQTAASSAHFGWSAHESATLSAARLTELNAPDFLCRLPPTFLARAFRHFRIPPLLCQPRVSRVVRADGAAGTRLSLAKCRNQAFSAGTRLSLSACIKRVSVHTNCSTSIRVHAETRPLAYHLDRHLPLHTYFGLSKLGCGFCTRALVVHAVQSVGSHGSLFRHWQHTQELKQKPAFLRSDPHSMCSFAPSSLLPPLIASAFPSFC